MQHNGTSRASLARLACLFALISHARAQRFSVDHYSQSLGAGPTGGGQPINEGSILTPVAGVALAAAWPPALSQGTVSLGLGGCAAPVAGVGCQLEVDALSCGADARIVLVPMPAGTYVFSVDRCSTGVPGALFAPNVSTEAPVEDAAADMCRDIGVGIAWMNPPPWVAGGNKAWVDGNGVASGSGSVYPGLGVLEPTHMNVPAGLFVGDELDAFDLQVPAGSPVYFSLDGHVPDACAGIGVIGTDSALAHGFAGSDVLIKAPGAALALYAAAAQLGLDLGGVDDDLDALALLENGVAGYQPSIDPPYDWQPGAGAKDMLLFSVRRGSGVIGMPDSRWGQPIEPGDILVPPPAAGLRPGIFIPAERLGLVTKRVYPLVTMADDLDALDTIMNPPVGIPFCFGDGSGTVCPCGPGASGHGCPSSVFAGGSLLAASGSTSLSADTLVLLGSDMPDGSALYFQGTIQQNGGAGTVFGDGLRCAGGTVTRLGTKTNVGGSSQYPSAADVAVSVKGMVTSPGTRTYQCWYRNAASWCSSSTFNLSNGMEIEWSP